jgi:hypothetical protein
MTRGTFLLTVVCKYDTLLKVTTVICVKISYSFCTRQIASRHSLCIYICTIFLCEEIIAIVPNRREYSGRRKGV